MTINDAIQKAIELAGSSLTADQIYEEIESRSLYRFVAKNPKGVMKGQLRRHCLGVEFPTASPKKYFVLVGVDKYDLISNRNAIMSRAARNDLADKSAEEKISETHSEHIEQVQSELLSAIVNSEPVFFEQLVIDLLLSMGYGERGRGIRRGAPGDGGIDGEIIQDRLGFDRIYIQAKRFSKSSIGRPEVQRFVGALEDVSKGVFITTSKFTEDARRYAAKQQQKQLVLVDGDQLVELMLSYGLGVSETASYKTYRVDLNYFEE